jgi:hypothetical protein
VVDFSDLLADDEDAVIDPRDIFLTLDRSERFSFPRDIQTEVMKVWFEARDQRDTIIKLNVGSGKTVVGLLLLQSSLNEGCGPALYVCPDNQLLSQVVEEATALGIDITEDPRDPDYASLKRICVTNVHTVFNGRSIFGVESIKLPIGTVVVDDAHACVATIASQFRIRLPNTHEAYAEILGAVGTDLRQQSPARFLELEAGDPRETMEVPFWAWHKAQPQILASLQKRKDTEELLFTYPLLREVLPHCRCIISGQYLEIEPPCPPVDLIRSFHRAKRRIYMTATLSDDSVLVTHFGASPERLGLPIVPTSSQSMGERMILMPQELNPNIEMKDIRDMLVGFAATDNVVIIVPSRQAAITWQEVADQVLIGAEVTDGIAKLRAGHVGLTVLVNRYDGIDLPGSACRVLAIIDLPEVSSLRDAADMAVLSDSTSALRRQMQRVEQGMGRGVRSNDDYCVVLLCGPKLTGRVKSPVGRSMLTGATQAQLDLSSNLAKKLRGTDIAGLTDVIKQCLGRDETWVKVSKRALLRSRPETGLSLDQTSIAVRAAFDWARDGDHPAALQALSKAEASVADPDSKAFLLARQAEIADMVDPVRAQKIQLAAHRLSRAVLRPIDGIAYQKLSPLAQAQAQAVQSVHKERFLEAADRILAMKALCDDLIFKPDTSKAFESALHDVALLIGIGAQRPERDCGSGPDNLWALQGGHFFVIECKNGATSQQGISKADMGQLGQSLDWFDAKYTKAVPRTPIIVHPLCTLGPEASPIDGARVVTEVQLAKLRDALCAFARALGDGDALADVNRTGQLLAAKSLTATAFVNAFSVPIR